MRHSPAPITVTLIPLDGQGHHPNVLSNTPRYEARNLTFEYLLTPLGAFIIITGHSNLGVCGPPFRINLLYLPHFVLSITV